MTCATRPHPTTPTLSRFVPVSDSVLERSNPAATVSSRTSRVKLAPDQARRSLCDTSVVRDAATTVFRARARPPRPVRPVTPIRLALVGAGRMGSTHARALARSGSEVELAAVVEPSDEVAARLGASLRRFRDTSELLAWDGVDGAIVAVPTRLHRDVVSQLLDSGLPVLCEKPCGLTSAETAAVAERARASGLRLHIGYWRRFVPGLRELQARIASGALGEVEAVLCVQWDEQPPPPCFRDPSSSGGIVVDMGVHEFDQLRWLTGQDVVEVTGVTSSVCFSP